MKGAALGLAVAGVLSSLAHAVPNVGTEPEWLASNDSDALDADASSHRALQASGRPDQCSDDASFQAWLALVNSACCTNAATQCTNGLPTSCDEECANVLTPVRSLSHALPRGAFPFFPSSLASTPKRRPPGRAPRPFASARAWGS